MTFHPRHGRHIPITLAVLLAAGLASILGGCNDGQSAEPELGPVVVASRPRAGGTDVTFFVTSDTHFGYDDRVDTEMLKVVDLMNNLPGTAWPREVGGRVETPKGVLVCGDLTDTGRGWQWRKFEAAFGLTGKDGKLKFPVYETIGNHDVYDERDDVPQAVAKRHERTYYSWDWGDLHLVAMSDGPDDKVLAWLERDLAANGRDRPVVAYLHYSILGPYSKSGWFGKGDYPERMGEILRQYNVIAIFHGHFHHSGHYRWKGMDVFDVGSVKHAAHSFAVVRVTDERLTVASWNWDIRTWWWLISKPINAAARPGEKPMAAVWPDPRLGRVRPLIPHPTD